MTATTTERIPQATLREEWAASRLSHWARNLEPVVAEVPAPDVQDCSAPSGRWTPRLADALLRLAADPRATAHERALAADRFAAAMRHA
ncbi:hypothetical protein F0U44_19615 [Nocardioides humilatus]|uniref:Uncharacterized protein n=1 Tax=Nocardioides humilatus TaxID=2607660 RepID=A0A5B1L7U6_9ACTN|nr:hypothetical protein [Nocardioides humilatus]KAA1415850.1 hypothetical protein F0U44_19615 [Nocardioides humilatus]